MLGALLKTGHAPVSLTIDRTTRVRRRKVVLILLYCLCALIICLQYTRNDTAFFYVNRDSETLNTAVRHGDFCVLPNVFESESIQDKERITLVLHVSFDYLDGELVEQVEKWNGPVSLTVYMEKPETQYKCLQKMLHDVYANSTIVNQYLQVHALYRSNNESCQIKPKSLFRLFDETCTKGNSSKTIESIAEYPANVARNVARMHVDSNYILIADYEHMFSEGFEEEVRKVAKEQLTKDPKQLLVYRIFEVSEKAARMPNNISTLAEMLKSKEAIVFHQAYYGSAHSMPGLNVWLHENGTEETNGIFLSNMSYTRYNWEPQFVSLSNIPMHDEAFPYQLRDNTCLRWELCRAGYKFSLISTHFMYHKGIKRRNSKAATKNHKVQKLNWGRFKASLKKFRARMDAEYPETKKTCPKFAA